MNIKPLIPATLILFAGLGVYFYNPFHYEVVQGENYTEYSYQPKHGPDEEAYEFDELKEQEDLLSEGKARLEWTDSNDDYSLVEVSSQELREGVLFKLQFQDQIYTLQSVSDDNPNTNPETVYRLLENGTEIFRQEMNFGAEGPVYRQNFINGDLALEFWTNEGRDIYYQGELISETTGLKNPSFLFTWNNKLGFFAEKADGKTYLFYDRQVVSPGFDQIHVISCCANFFFLPQLYEGGLVVFKGQGGESPSFVEVQL